MHFRVGALQDTAGLVPERHSRASIAIRESDEFFGFLLGNDDFLRQVGAALEEERGGGSVLHHTAPLVASATGPPFFLGLYPQPHGHYLL